MTQTPKQERAPLSRSERINVQIAITQTVLAVAGIFIGAVALYAALGEAEAVRKQQQASVWPRLQFGRSYTGIVGQEKIAFEVGNQGIGPAKVEHVSFTYKGESITDWYAFATRFSGGEQFGISTDPVANRIIPSGDVIETFSVEERFASVAITRAIRDAYDSGEIQWSLCYCSVFDECWTVRRDARDEEPVDHCSPMAPDSAL